MASKSKFSSVGLGFLLCSFLALIMLLFCLMITQEHSVCVTGQGCCYGEMEKKNRKLLSEKEVVAMATGGVHVKGGHKMGDSELRMVPSGPDPLHHNGNPKKPRTP